jgi:hypothetical protein
VKLLFGITLKFSRRGRPLNVLLRKAGMAAPVGCNGLFDAVIRTAASSPLKEKPDEDAYRRAPAHDAR